MGDNQAIVDEVLELEDQRCRAVTSMDWTALDHLLAEEFTYTHSTGVPNDKAMYFEAIKRRPRTMIGRDRDVRIYGDTAVITGTLVNTLPGTDGEEPRVVELRTLQVWVRGADGWKQVATAQSGPLQPA